MKSYRRLALKNVLKYRITSVLIIFAIMLSTIMTTVAGQSIGILQAMREQQAITISGKRHATFLQLNADQVDSIKEDLRFSYVGESIYLGHTELNPSLTLGLTEYHDKSYLAYPSDIKIKQGRLPNSAMEVVLSEETLKYLGFNGKIGDTIKISLAKSIRHETDSNLEYEVDLILTGITEDNYLGYGNGIVTGIVGEGTARNVLPEEYIFYNVDICVNHLKDFQTIVSDLCNKLKIPESDISYNSIYLNALGVSYDNEQESSEELGFSLIALSGILVACLIIFAAGLVIYNILKISITKSIKDYGLLRAIGGEKKQLYQIVTMEIGILDFIGIPLGLILGTLSTQVILKAATGFVNPSTFGVANINELEILISDNSSIKGLALVVSAIITLLFSFVAAAPVAMYASKVPPVIAMSGAKVKIHRRKRSRKSIRNFESYYAWLNLKRSKGRTVITVLSLIMSIAVFIALQSFTSTLNLANSLEEKHFGDYEVVNQTVGFTSEEVEQIKNRKEVDSIGGMKFSIYTPDEMGSIQELSLNFTLQPGETLQIVGINEAYWKYRFKDSEFSNEDKKQLEEGSACVVCNPVSYSMNSKEMPSTKIKAGETIFVEGKNLRVISVLEGYSSFFGVGNTGITNGVQIIVNDDIYTELTGKNNYVELHPVLHEESARENFEQFLEGFCSTIPGSSYISYEESDQQLKESFEQVRVLGWILILFIGLIGVLNIINTVYTNIHSRMEEIAIQRAIGMGTKSLYKTFVWEGMYYGMGGLLGGGILGCISAVLICFSATGTIKLISISPMSVIGVIVITFIVCLISTCIPLRKISNMSIVDALTTIE